VARIKQSVVVPMFLGAPPKLSMEEVCRAAAEIGYAAVEMWGAGEDFEDQVATAHRYGLRVASFGGHRGGGLGWNNRADHEVLEQQLRASLDLAVKHDVPGLICLSGNRQEGRSQEEAIAVTAEGLARVAPYAEEKGVNLNLEVLNSKVDHAGYDCDSTAWAVAVCRLVNSPRVRILYDIYHMQIMEGDVIRTIRDNIEWIGHFHTAGNPGRHDMDDEQELNYAGICRAIAATGYDLYVGHEFSAKGDVVAALRQAFQHCDQG
jgi:hydroxypyruvate isomerase